MENYLIIFFVYSFCGWFLESVGGILNVKKFVNRGFLIGPYCPVYGIGVLLITILLYKHMNDLLVLYFMSVLICGVLEYLTSYIMEKVFHARWWDYHNIKFNINGRICLETLLPFGLVGLLLVKYVNPWIFGIVRKIPETLLLIILFILTILFVIDVIISFSVILKFRKNVKNVEREIKDNTDEIVQKVKEETGKKLEEVIEEFEKFKYKISLKLQASNVNVVYRSAKLQKRIEEYRLKKAKEKELTREKLRKLAQKITDSSNELKKNLKLAREEWKNKQEIRRKNIEDLTKLVKEKYFKNNILSNRLFKAFPEMKVKSKENNEKNKF